VGVLCLVEVLTIVAFILLSKRKKKKRKNIARINILSIENNKLNINKKIIILSYVPPRLLVGWLFGCPLGDAHAVEVIFFEGVTIRASLVLTLGLLHFLE
jgi:hypothetical protein